MMGRYCAHSLDRLPPAIAERVHRTMAMLESDVPIDAEELADAAAQLAAPASIARQQSFDLTPPPKRLREGKT